MKLRVLDLFSGIGGFSLGLERTGGFETVAFCEIEDYPRRVLAKHWPNVFIYDDVRTLTADALARDGIAVDVICGGFPCQDISFAGKRAGLQGQRSGLWSEYARLIGELRPRYVIVENVPGLLNLGMGTVLGDLSALGYDATWDCIPAAAVGAPHRRDRVWIVGHTNNRSEPTYAVDGEASGVPFVANARSRRRSGASGRKMEQQGRAETKRSSADLAHAHGGDGHGRGGDVQMGRQRLSSQAAEDGYAGRTEWFPEPGISRVAHGVSSRVDRLRGLGNAVVPQVVELIGRAIIQAEARQ